MDDVVEFDFEVPQCSHCGVDGCVLHWFCAYPDGFAGQRSPPRLPSCPSSHEHLDVG